MKLTRHLGATLLINFVLIFSVHAQSVAVRSGNVHTLGCTKLLEEGSGACLMTLRSNLGGIVKVKLRPSLSRGLSATQHFHGNAYKHKRRLTVSASIIGAELRISLANFRRHNFFMIYSISRNDLEHNQDGQFKAIVKRIPGYIRLACGEHTVAQALGQGDDTTSDTLELGGSGANAQLDLWMLADTNFVARFGANSMAELQNAQNFTDSLYQSDLGIKLNATHTLLSSAHGITSSDAETLIDQLQSYGLSQKSPVRDSTVLISGKDFTGPAVGLAYFAVTCRVPSAAYGVIEGINSSLTPIIMAHELGHNIGASHDPDSSGIMKGMLGGDMTFFSAFSAGQINDYLSHNGSCVSGIAQSDPNLSASLILDLWKVGSKKQKFKFSIKRHGSGSNGARVELWGATRCSDLNNAALLPSQANMIGYVNAATMTEGVAENIQAKTSRAKSAKHLCFRLAIAEGNGSNRTLTGANKKVTLKSDGKSSANSILEQLAAKIAG